MCESHFSKMLKRSCELFRLIKNQAFPSRQTYGYQVAPRLFCSEPLIPGPDINAIAKDDKELEQKLKVLILEVDVMRQEGRLVPEDSFLKDHHWKELLNLASFSARRRYLEFLFKTSKKKENHLLKKQQKAEEYAVRLSSKPAKAESFEDFVHRYDLQHNNVFLRFYDTTMNQFYNNRLVQAMQFGQKVVVDCGFDDKMTIRENKNCAKQLMLLFAENRAHEDPFDVHFCNIRPEKVIMENLQRAIPNMYETSFPMNLHQKSYLDLFPREKLVYLTPHCREEMMEFDHDAIYIIGAIVDKVNNEPLSLAKAKKEGLKMAKLPFDHYLQWSSGSGKSLTLNQVLSILLDVKLTRDWKYALKHVPRRKLVDYNVSQKPSLRPTGSWSPKYNANSFDETKSIRSSRDVNSIMYDDN